MWAAFKQVITEYDEGHTDGYLPYAFVGPFASQADAILISDGGTPIKIYSPEDESWTPGSYCVFWFGRQGTIGLIGGFETWEAAREHVYDDELTGTGIDGTSCVVELMSPDDYEGLREG